MTQDNRFAVRRCSGNNLGDDRKVVPEQISFSPSVTAADAREAI
jgi:hypothetical protein